MPRKPIPAPVRPHNLTPPTALRPKPAAAVRRSSKPPVTGDKAVGSKGVQKRSQDRLSRLISRGGAAPLGVKPGKPVTVAQAKAIKQALLNINAKNRHHPASGGSAPASFDPLAQLSGKDFESELAAAKRSQFGDSDQALKDAYDNNQSAQELSGSYFDQYKQALADAAKRIGDAHAAEVQDVQGRVDSAYTQDSAAAKARADAASNQAGSLGLSGAPSTEGARAVEAARTLGNTSVASAKERQTSSTELQATRGAEAVHAKASALTGLLAGRGKIDNEATKLANEKGDFATNYRSKVRDSEREWAAVQEEFGLKKAAADTKSKDNAAERRIEQQKIAAQKLIAKTYADADKTKARATIRVAKLQLEKGKIDQHQYNEIVNIYKGLPKKGKPTPPKSTTPRDPANGSGPNGTLAPWESDDVDRATGGYTKNKYAAKDRNRAIAKAVQAGIPRRLAVQAWNQYIGHVKTPYDNRTRG